MDAYAIEGQFFNWVPSKTSHSLLVTEKSISGAPPGPLIIMLKAIGITYAILLAYHLESFPGVRFLHQCHHLQSRVSSNDHIANIWFTHYRSSVPEAAVPCPPFH